ncbi:hypothetical protein [Enterovibrio norvegicus]|uniref:hypothetical protein n=1 Tax=Enterovibrio norvegicus TaxID=188144 RepID=UPI001041E777|nr:hypothetical protein [Enterovibrio norvegicus]
MKLLLVLLACLAFPALAADALAWDTALVALFGETGQAVVFWASLVLVLWSQVRQIIPPQWLAKLPTWVINLLEYLAANKGRAANDLALNPAWQRKQKKLGID